MDIERVQRPLPQIFCCFGFQNFAVQCYQRFRVSLERENEVGDRLYSCGNQVVGGDERERVPRYLV